MIAALLVLGLQDVDVLVGRLTAEDVEVRGRAERELLDLPAKLLPRILESLGRLPEPEARSLEDRIRVAPAWIALYPGSVRAVRSRAEVVEQVGHPDREKAVAGLLEVLRGFPPGEAPKLLLPLLADPAEGTRLFALAALRRFPPSDPAPLLAYLPDVRTSGLAAEVLVAMGAESVVPRAVDLFVEEGGGTLGAARILEAFGAGAHAERIARAVREKAGLLVWGIRILRATGPAAEPQLLALAPDVSYPRRREIVEALSLVGGKASARLVGDVAFELPPEERLELIWKFGDRDLASAVLLRNIRAADLDRLAYAPIATSVRARVVEQGATPALLNLLGAVGGPDDIPLLRKLGATEALDRIGLPPRPLPALDLRGAKAVPRGRVAITFDLVERLEAVPGLAARADADAVATLRRLADDPTLLPDGSRIWHWAMAGLEKATGVKTEGTSTSAQRAFWRNR